ncbi:hypothetical protein KFL_005510050 [Klebsormidium nitens]|uniref:Uncharacterized protein n=1 Tax=Klebsormidium nitens TaxID=105231 RepID=A0A1Y1IFR0_KLENI|nr:hypothetical protein KFL_005510050 [Klebsormidium nitens]|eukprot:GAQ89690.1 hypothetical protein KFL_005510050 [Klebsormidium nitens]
MGPGASAGGDVNGPGSVNGASSSSSGGGVNRDSGANANSGVNGAGGGGGTGGVNGGPGVNRRSGVNGARGGGVNGARVDDTGFVNWVRKEFNVTREALRISRNKKADAVVEKERETSNGAATTSGREKFVDSVFGDEDDWTEEMEEAWRFEARGFDEQDLKIRDPGKEGGPLIFDLPREDGKIQADRTADIWNIEDWREPRKIKQGSWDVYDVMKEQAETEETEGPKSKEAAVAEYLELLQRRKRRELYKDYEPAEETERLQLPVGEYKGPDTFRESFDEVGEPLENPFQEVYALMHAFSVEMPFPLRTLVDERVLNYGTYFWTKFLEINADERIKFLDWIDHRHMEWLWRLGEQRYSNIGTRMYTHAAKLLPVRGVTKVFRPQVWIGKVDGAPPFFGDFHRVIWVAPDSNMYGRTVLLPNRKGWLRRFIDETFPLYFRVKQTNLVVATERPCDMVIEYVTDMSELDGNIPPEYPKPVPPPHPFNDAMKEYMRPLGPGLMVCEAWHEGVSPEATPKPFLKTSVMARVGPGTVKAF